MSKNKSGLTRYFNQKWISTIWYFSSILCIKYVIIRFIFTTRNYYESQTDNNKNISFHNFYSMFLKLANNW